MFNDPLFRNQHVLSKHELNIVIELLRTKISRSELYKNDFLYPFAIETTTEEDCNQEDDGEDQLKMSLEKLTRPFAKASLMLCVKSIAEDTLAGNANSAVD